MTFESDDDPASFLKFLEGSALVAPIEPEDDDIGGLDPASFLDVLGSKNLPRTLGVEGRSALDAEKLRVAAALFTQEGFTEPALFGVTDGKTIGTYVEHRFKDFLGQHFDFDPGNSALGIDFPSIATDLKVTSLKQPQSSSPFTSTRQKIYGLGHNLLVLMYEKIDDRAAKTSALRFTDTIFIEARCTGDFFTTRGLRQLIENHADEHHLVAFMRDADLLIDHDVESPPAQEILKDLAREVLRNPPTQGYLTLCNALQWRLQYSYAIECAGLGQVDGVVRVR